MRLYLFIVIFNNAFELRPGAKTKGLTWSILKDLRLKNRPPLQPFTFQDIKAEESLGLDEETNLILNEKENYYLNPTML